MSHQTGITADNKLLQFLGKCRDGDIRLMKISIRNEELVLESSCEPRSDWESDFSEMMNDLVEEQQPSYILCRYDNKNSCGYEWLFISWSPDDAPVKEKMLYAGTKASMKKLFGGSQIKDELFATSREDVTLAGYHAYQRAEKAPAPLTNAEEELADMKKSESGEGVGVDTHQTITGVAFPTTESALEALHLFKHGRITYVQLCIDLSKEEIDFVFSDLITVDSLPSKVPTDHARYHLFNFHHSYDGDYLESNVFIYSMPGYNCSIKERMLYSSCKSPLLEVIEQQVGITVTKKMEISTGEELTKDNLIDEIHPKKNLHRPKFAKPKGPPNRGAKRITRTEQTEQ